MASARGLTETEICLTCGDKGETRLLIYCAKCRDAAVHHYCLEKFSPDDDEIYWMCWECEPSVNMIQVPRNGDEFGINSSYNRDVEKPPEHIVENGNCTNHGTCFRHKNEIRSLEKWRPAEEVLNCPQVIDMKQQKRRLKNQRRRLVRKRRKTLKLGGSNSSKEDIGTQEVISSHEKIKLMEVAVPSPSENIRQTFNQKNHVQESVSSVLIDGVKCTRAFDENQRHYDVKDRRRLTLDKFSKTKDGIVDVEDRNNPSIKLIGAKTSLSSPELNEIGTSTPRISESKVHKNGSLAIGPSTLEERAKSVWLFDEIQRNQEARRRERILTHDNTNPYDFIGDYSVGATSLASPLCPMPRGTSCGHLCCEDQSNIFAQPVRSSIWGGCFSIAYENDKVDISVVAHLNINASSKVFHTVVTVLPFSLIICLQPKDSLWPKSFHDSPPKDDSIALFFFPKHERRDEEVFECLLDVITEHNLALKTMVMQDVELLIFSSIELPQRRRFDGKYYLWGVFVDKRLSRTTLSLDSNGHDNQALRVCKSLKSDEIGDATLQNSVEKHLMRNHVQCATACAKWHGLDSESTDLSAELQRKLLELSNYQKHPEHSVKQHTLVMSRMINELKELGVNLSHELQTQAVLQSLPNSWEQIKINLTCDEDIKTFEDVACFLESMDEHLVEGNSSNALRVPYNSCRELHPKFENDGGVHGHPTISRRKQVGKRGKMKIICYNCGKVGHFAHECSKIKSKMSCFLCGGLGHFARECIGLSKIPFYL